MVKSEHSIQPSLPTTPQLPPSTISAKRKKQDDHEHFGQAAKKKPRTRVSYSCGECHRRKQKCDRQIPCSHCIARKVPDLCKAYTPGKSDQDTHARLSRLEHIMELAFPQFAALSSSNPPSPAVDMYAHSRANESRSPSPDDDGSQADEGDIGAGSFDIGGKWYGKSVSGSVAPVHVLEQLTHVGPSNNHASLHAQLARQSMNSSRQNAVEFPEDNVSDTNVNVLHNAEPSAADLLQSLIRDCGLSENKVQELMCELPSRESADTLIDYYFNNMNWTRYPISERDFRTSYAALFVDGMGSEANDIRFLPLLFVVLAISARLSPERIGGNTRKLTSMRFYWASRRALLVAAAIQPDSLEMVLTRLLSARYLTFDRRITECWSQLGAAVCTAQALGLHRDPGPMIFDTHCQRLDPAQVEYRRRIWAYLYHADRSYSMVLGRPYAIQDEYTTTLPPLNLEDLTSLSPTAIVPPLSTPTRMTFVILRHGLAYLIGKMVHYFQRVRIQNHYSEVMALDDELQRFIDSLPFHFSFNPDTSLDNIKEYSYIPVHRYLLTTEILFVRMSLHRPYILRRLDSDRYARSRRAAFSAALLDFEVRQSYRAMQSKDVSRMVGNAYREFQTAMISGIYLILDPCGKDAEAMHHILDTFLNNHENINLEDLDYTTRRELKIIEFLKKKALQSASQSKHRIIVDASPSLSDRSRDAQANANLLLSLHRSHKSRVQHARSASDSSSPRPRSTFTPSYINRPMSPAETLVGPGAGGMLSVPQSPTFQRVQAQSFASSQRYSPAVSGSPGAEEDMSAQNMLDNWCNAVTNPPPLLLDSVTGPAIPLSSGQWGTFSNVSVSGPAADWMNAPYDSIIDPCASNGLEGDYGYWEYLVNTIRSGSVQ